MCNTADQVELKAFPLALPPLLLYSSSSGLPGRHYLIFLHHVGFNMGYQNEDSIDSEPFLDDASLAEDKPRLLKDRKKVSTTKSRAVLYILAAHLSGWMLALCVPPWFATSPLRSGDEINQIVPPSTSDLLFPLISTNILLHKSSRIRQSKQKSLHLISRRMTGFLVLMIQM